MLAEGRRSRSGCGNGGADNWAGCRRRLTGADLADELSELTDGSEVFEPAQTHEGHFEQDSPM